MFNEVITSVEVVLVRVRKDGEFSEGLAKPCSSCIPVLKHFGVSRVHYSTGNGRHIASEWVKTLKTDHACSGARPWEK